MLVRPTLLASSFLFLAACSGTSSSGAEEPANGGTEGSATPPAAEPGPVASEPGQSAAATPSYVVHEWGLVDIDLQGSIELAAGPGRPPPTMSVRKPVLYVQLDPGVEALTFSASVDVPGATIVEHWPAGTLSATSLSWPSVQARRCEGDSSARDLPDTSAREATRGRRVTRACDTPDGYCEVADLPTYVAAGSACLRVGSEEGTLLFYRAALQARSMPYAIARAGTQVSVRARSSFAGPAGTIWRITRTPEGVRVHSMPAPTEAGATVMMAEPTEPIDVASARQEMKRELMALGLTDAEAEAFLRAWASEFFEPLTGRTSPPVPADVVLYWMPRAEIDRLAPLSFDPPPRELVRAMMVRQEF